MRRAVSLAWLLSALFILSALAWPQEGDPLAAIFSKAKAAYLAGNYPSAQAVLEALLPQLEKDNQRAELFGEANLLLGACFEKLLLEEQAIKHFCAAKRVLGEGRSIEGLDLSGFDWYKKPCPDSALPGAVMATEDPALVNFKEAKSLFFKHQYEKARAILERVVVDVSKVARREPGKGEVYLLMGALYERVKEKELAFKFFCLAKSLLGKDKSIEGLDLDQFKQYKKDCPISGSYNR